MSHPGRRRGSSAIATLLVAAACAGPHLALRAARPSLYSDDVARIEMLQTLGPGKLLGRPFNEHLAPGFDLVTLAAWQAAGERLASARWSFTLAALLPSVLAALVLGRIAARETGSQPAGLAAVALFSLSSIDLETFWWYSASSFTWALLGSLLAWWGVMRGGRLGGALALTASAAAPAFSGIGLLAGPVAAVRGLGGHRHSRQRWRLAAACGAGTLVYLVAAAGAGHNKIVAASVERNLSLGSGLASVARAPWVRLVPGVLRLDGPALEDGLPTGLAGGLSLATLAGLVFLSRRSPRRGAVLASLAMIVGGYGLAYTIRADLSGGAEAMRRIQRYHLFPHAGLVLLLALGLDSLFRRGRAWKRVRPRLAPALAVVLLLVHLGRMRDFSRFYAFTGQPELLAALDLLAEQCRAEGITREQALAALSPLRVPWTPVEGLAPLRMLARCARSPGMSDHAAREWLDGEFLQRPKLLALHGGMDASSRVRDGRAASHSDAPVLTAAPGGAWFREFRLRDQEIELSLPRISPRQTLELWWADAGEKWSVVRSVWLRAGAGADQSLPVAELPHWTAPRDRRLRWVVRGPAAGGDEPTRVR